MALSPGTRLAAYEIIAPLGTGGMGEVYRARDTTLDRDVALKVLPDLFAGDPERLGRFEREAKTLAALNHPNIAHIHGVVDAPAGDQDGRGAPVRGLVMELVEGPTVAEIIGEGNRLGVSDAIRIARQLADALEAAHERGVIHRDLKPANIKVTIDGTVKVLDFGLAKAMEPGAVSGVDVLNSPTITSPAATRAGVVLGTAAYMSPEQARGRVVDRRADVWAFGCVLYEMLTGRRPFDGESITDVLAAVLKNDPDWTLLPADTPPALLRVLRRCLERDPRRRLRDMADVRLDLDEPHDRDAARQPARPARHRILMLLTGLLAGILITVSIGWMWLRPGRAAPAEVRRFGLTLPLVLDAQQSITLSPDGRHLAFRGRGADGVDRLYVRALDALAPRGIPGTEGARLPFFSTDGQQIAFFVGGHLKRVSLAGGEPQVIAPAASPTGGSWGDDNTIVFVADTHDILRVPASGGPVETLLENPEGQVATPWALPGGRGVLFAVRDGARFDIAVLSLPDRRVRVLAESGWTPVWSETGHVLYQQNDTIVALPFDLRRLEATGAAVPALVGIGTRISLQARMFSAARDGTLAYMPAASGADSRWTIAWVDRNGQESDAAAFAEPVDSPRLSPDGARVAFRKPAPNCDVWSYEFARGTSTRLTLGGDNHGVVWSPDGDEVMSLRIGDRRELITVPSDGSGRVDRVPIGASTELAWPTSWAGPVETALVTQGSDVVAVSTRSGEAQRYLDSPFQESHAVFSPEGRWVAYVSDQSGRGEVYVQPYPGPGRRLQVSTDGGSEPLWSRDGRELFFRSGRALQAVTFDPGAGPHVSRPRTLFSSDHLTGAGSANYDVSPDSKRFLMVRGPASREDLVIVLDWGGTWAQRPVR